MTTITLNLYEDDKAIWIFSRNSELQGATPVTVSMVEGSDFNFTSLTQTNTAHNIENTSGWISGDVAKERNFVLCYITT